MTTPTEILRDEHRVILRALDVLESAADRLAAGGTVPDGWWSGLVEWLRAFADQNHHAKEERLLFPAMRETGLPGDGGPIAVMLEEHDRGRFLVHEMERGDALARVARARDYIRELREHIAKENGVLFPLADTLLDPRAQRAVEREFEALLAEHGPGASLAVAEAAIERLAVALGSGILPARSVGA